MFDRGVSFGFRGLVCRNFYRFGFSFMFLNEYIVKILIKLLEIFNFFYRFYNRDGEGS